MDGVGDPGASRFRVDAQRTHLQWRITQKQRNPKSPRTSTAVTSKARLFFLLAFTFMLGG